jgi:hypothetical protein
MESNFNFTLEKEALHRLEHISNLKKYCTQIGSHHYFFSFSQIALLSWNAFQHFLDNDQPFIIETQFGISVQDLKNLFNSFINLLQNQSELIINVKNVNALTYLAQKLDNTPLLLKCFTSDATKQIFSFSLKVFRFVPQFYKKSINDFK